MEKAWNLNFQLTKGRTVVSCKGHDWQQRITPVFKIRPTSTDCTQSSVEGGRCFNHLRNAKRRCLGGSPAWQTEHHICILCTYFLIVARLHSCNRGRLSTIACNKKNVKNIYDIYIYQICMILRSHFNMSSFTGTRWILQLLGPPVLWIGSQLPLLRAQTLVMPEDPSFLLQRLL